VIPNLKSCRNEFPLDGSLSHEVTPDERRTRNKENRRSGVAIGDEGK
jgi:predicted PolB exonuclease-like 3'-5' exonuclease